ncbi:hypothetical protein [uncultured Pseudoteredinibacter sp.]|uniref:hypothetical protein n=1 Tax=uncultured Pseudoteredinibacter sp. TaxID=1641701 RepID=UPI002625E37D|nr:hypothetical protein [uncultured Pseudoteredinibacter sp.]
MNKLFFILLISTLTLCCAVQVSAQGELAQILKNPSEPINAKPGLLVRKKPSYVLQSILISPSRRLAQINGNLLNIGDSLGSYKLIEISKNSATLKSSKGKLVLKTQSSSTNTKITLR